MKWKDMPWYMQLWWGMQVIVLVIVLLSTPVGALILALFWWYILRPIFWPSETHRDDD